jgi:hypothetical protein
MKHTKKGSLRRKKLRKISRKRKLKGGEINPLSLYTPPFPKKRIGKSNDGGYVICEIPNISYDLLLSGGISNDTSFEDNFLKLYPTVQCYAFDETIDSSPSKNNKFNFIKKNIGATNTDKVTNLHEYLNKYKNIFVKMDIEGGELDWLNSLNSEHMNNISQMVIEFHSITKDNLPLFEKINQTHIQVNFHGNNCCSTNTDLGFIIPNVFESLYINRKYITAELPLNKETIPLNIDQPNIASNPDIIIDTPPFVNKILL